MANIPYLDIATKAADQLGVSLPEILGIIRQESNFNPNAVSKTGAQGLMQLMPGTAKDLGVTNPLDPEQNIMAGTKYYAQLLQKTGDPNLARAAYNAGLGNVNKYGGVPPFPETQKYVPAVENYTNQYAQILGNQQPTPSQPQPPLSPPPDVGLPPQPSGGSGARTAATILATLGGLGGQAANIIGAIKNSGAPGNAAIEQSTSLLDMLSKQSQLEKAQQAFASNIKGVNAPDEIKRLALSYAQSGDVGAAQGVLAKYTQDVESKKTAIQSEVEKQNALLPGKRQEEIFKANLGLEKERTIEDYRNGLKKDFEKFKSSLKTEDPSKTTDAAMKLRKEYNAIPVIKQSRELEAQVNRANSVWGDYVSKGGKGDRNALDQTLVITFNKILDPDSVVRESEYARTPEGVAFINKLQSIAPKLAKGGLSITDADRKDFMDKINLMMSSQKTQADSFKKFYQDEALRSGIDPARIVLEESNSAAIPSTATNQEATSPLQVNGFKKGADGVWRMQ